jgi:3-methyladenine DNA glycosylase AlkD
MKAPTEIVSLAEELRTRLNALAFADAASVRAVRREFSRRIAKTAPESVIQLALRLFNTGSGSLRWVSYELICSHRRAFEQLTLDDLLKFGKGLDSWSSVDCFAMYLSGPMWAQGKVSDDMVEAWANSRDRWWRRAALVSTVALSRGGDVKDLRRVERICTPLLADRDDMVVKALSWALREAAKKHPRQVSRFLARHRDALASRVVREVDNKLTTGLKTPRGRIKKA